MRPKNQPVGNTDHYFTSVCVQLLEQRVDVGEVPRFRAHFARGKKTMTKVNQFLTKLGMQGFFIVSWPTRPLFVCNLFKFVAVAFCMLFYIWYNQFI
jgi:hypothetical protein